VPSSTGTMLSMLSMAVLLRVISFAQEDRGRGGGALARVARRHRGRDASLRRRISRALLLAAGYAPAWRERQLSAPGMEIVQRALDYMFAQHEPFPAFVVDRRWNVLRANGGAANLVEFLTGPATRVPDVEPVNLAIALMSPEGLRPLIVNWEEVATHFLQGVQNDANADGTPETMALLTRLSALADRPLMSEALPPEEGSSPVLPMHFRRGGKSLCLFTTIATLGTPRDITLDEIRIEFFFPADDATETICRGWASSIAISRQGARP
jgi:MmyB-like transcription regulator ligand binding domain